MQRRGGILLHISSLPSDCGIGSLGASARTFVDFLADAGIREWQMLPINPQGMGNSPYKSFSSFAGNPLFIDLPSLVEAGLLTDDELSSARLQNNVDRVEFDAVTQSHTRLLRLAYSRFDDFSRLIRFSERESAWLSDYASFMAIKDAYCGGDWQSFPTELRDRSALSQWRAENRAAEDYYKFEQMLFFEQWQSLRDYANARNVRLIGDVPIYVALDSDDVWAHNGLFCLDSSQNPTEVAGCPPDVFSADGQLWGNPIYNWQAHEADGFDWWCSRMKHLSRLFDTVRIDHFRGFEAFWAVPACDTTARGGRWVKGPGIAFFNAVKAAVPELNIIAEDLGFLTDEVFALRDVCGFPGMRVLQFAFDSDESNLYLPHRYIENCVAYTGTHDNNTTRGWVEEAPQYKLDFARWYLKPYERESLTDAFIRAVWSSAALLAIAPIQDFLNLPSSARMNTPSTVNDVNWRFRMRPDALTAELAERILQLNRSCGRI